MRESRLENSRVKGGMGDAAEDEVVAHDGFSSRADVDQAITFDDYVIQLQRLADIAARKYGGIFHGAGGVEQAVAHDHHVRSEANARTDAAVLAKVHGWDQVGGRVQRDVAGDPDAFLHFASIEHEAGEALIERGALADDELGLGADSQEDGTVADGKAACGIQHELLKLFTIPIACDGGDGGGVEQRPSGPGSSGTERQGLKSRGGFFEWHLGQAIGVHEKHRAIGGDAGEGRVGPGGIADQVIPNRHPPARAVSEKGLDLFRHMAENDVDLIDHTRFRHTFDDVL